MLKEKRTNATHKTKKVIDDPVDVDAIAYSIIEYEKNQTTKTDDEVLAEGAQPFSRGHQNKREGVVRDFVFCLEQKKEKWGKLLDMVEIGDGQSMLKLFHIMQTMNRIPSQNQIKLFNSALIDWNLVTKKQRLTSNSSLE